MWVICGRTLLIVIAMFALASAASAQSGSVALPSQQMDLTRALPPGGFATIRSMKLLAPDVGLVFSDQGLYKTTDGGANWKNITPSFASDCDDCSSWIGNLFFLDARSAWAEIEYGEWRADTLHPPILASTADGGATWSQVHFTFPGFDQNVQRSQGWMKFSFADPRHGWALIVIEMPGRQNADSHLLETNDGGRSWNWTPSSPETTPNDSILRVTQSDGWMLSTSALGCPDAVPEHPVVGSGAPAPGRPAPMPLGFAMETPQFLHHRQRLCVTHDGARSWQKLSLEAPLEVSEVTSSQPRPPASTNSPWYDLPVFVTPAHGYLSVTYRPTFTFDESTAVLFETNDGGRTWRADRSLKLPQVSHPQNTVIDSTWLVYVLAQGHPTIFKVAPGANVKAEINPAYLSPQGTFLGGYPPDNPYSVISFCTPTRGWLLAPFGGLLSTSDGGSTWTELHLRGQH